MKRTLSLILALLILTVPALADAPDIDLSALSFDELVALNQAVDREIMTRPEWKSVTLPAGDFYAGVDFPAGRYIVSLDEKDDGSYTVSVIQNGSKTFYLLNGSEDKRNIVATFADGDVLHTTSDNVINLSRFSGLFN